jgi:integrase/recombinase XerD
MSAPHRLHLHPCFAGPSARTPSGTQPPTHLLRSGVDINTICAWLGHVSIDTTNICAEVDLQRKAEVLAHSNVLSTTPITNKQWKDDPSLLAFLRSL